LLHFSGLLLPTEAETGRHWSRKFIQKLEEMDCGQSTELKAALQIKLQDYLHKRNLLLQSTRAIRHLYRHPDYWPLMQLILSIPGIGEINAAIILFELQDIFRFKTFDNLCSYVGLIPRTEKIRRSWFIPSKVARLHCFAPFDQQYKIIQLM